MVHVVHNVLVVCVLCVMHLVQHVVCIVYNMLYALYTPLLRARAARPWLHDDLDRWIARVTALPSCYQCVAIFCDNSGADIILGVIPLAREFLKAGSKVRLCIPACAFSCSSSWPAAAVARLGDCLDSHHSCNAMICVVQRMEQSVYMTNFRQLMANR